VWANPNPTFIIHSVKHVHCKKIAVTTNCTIGVRYIEDGGYPGRLICGIDKMGRDLGQLFLQCRESLEDIYGSASYD
jgi:hypothetical protein